MQGVARTVNVRDGLAHERLCVLLDLAHVLSEREPAGEEAQKSAARLLHGVDADGLWARRCQHTQPSCNQ